MRFELPEGYKVRYHHDAAPEPTFFLRRIPDATFATERHFGSVSGTAMWIAFRRRTRALIIDPDGDVVAEGKAICRPDEPFCRRIGRDVARGRALKALAAVPR
jgi:hypothetical protein